MPKALFDAALERHRAGDLTAAAALYQEVLAQEPAHPEARSNLGVTLLQQGRLDDALACYREALARRPGDVNAALNLAQALRLLGRLEDAAAVLSGAAGQSPDEPEIALRRAVLMRDSGRPDEALSLLRKARGSAPRDPRIPYEMARTARALGRPGEAETWLGEALGLAPTDPDILLELGALCHQEGRFDEAESRYRSALGMAPQRADVLSNLGALFLAQGRAGEAVGCLSHAVTLAPDFAEARSNLGLALIALERFDEAAAELEAALAMRPEMPEAALHLGNVLKEKGEVEAAEMCYRRALAAAPDYAEAHLNLGNVLVLRGRQTEALGAYDAAVALAPESAEAHFNRSLLLLLLGRYGEGFDEYEWRYDVLASLRRDIPWPRWEGGDARGRALFVYDEQGPGDVVMFASCLSDLLAAGARVSLEVDRRLARLMARSFPAISVRPRSDEAPPAAPPGGPPDHALAIGSLPRHFRRDEESFGRTPARYLAPDPALCARWRRRLSALGPGLKVGISWRGGATPTEKRLRSRTLAEWHPLLETPGVTFVNLQYGESAGEIAEAAAALGVRIADWPDNDPAHDLDGLAALIDGLDLVISVANTTVHFAGALGKPTWTLVPEAPSWRWQLGRPDSPWYPAVRLFRQARSEPFAALVRRVAERLQAELARPS